MVRLGVTWKGPETIELWCKISGPGHYPGSISSAEDTDTTVSSNVDDFL